MSYDPRHDKYCQAWWRFEQPAFLVDSSGKENHLVTGWTPPAAWTDDFREGSGCAKYSVYGYFEAYDNPYMEEEDNINYDFPFRHNDGTKQMTACCRFKLEGLPSFGQSYVLFSKTSSWFFTIYNHYDEYYSFKLGMKWGGSFDTEIVEFTPDRSIAIEEWFFIAVVLSPERTWKVYIYNYMGDVTQEITGIWSKDIISDYGSFYIGHYSGDGFKGLQDDVVIFNRCLESSELLQIRLFTFDPGVDRMRGILNGSSSHYASLGGLSAAKIDLVPQFPVEEELMWMTEVLSAHGRQQRIAKRKIPRQSFKYRFIFDSEQGAAEFQAMLHSYTKRPWGIPVWTESSLHTDPLIAGAGSIDLNTQYADYRDNSFGFIWDGSLSEIIHISNKTNAVLNLSKVLENSYPGGKYIMPLRIGYAVEPITQDVYPKDALFADIVFSTIDSILVTGFVSRQSYDNMEVLNPTYIESTQKVNVDGDLLLLDHEIGKFDIASDNDFNKTNQGHLFYNDTREDCWWFRQFLFTVYGMQKAFLVPTNHEDMHMSRPLGALDHVLYIENIGLTKNMGTNTMRDYMAFMVGGTPTVRKIVAITEISDSEETVEMTSEVGIMPLGTKTCFVDKVCLAQDSVKITWQRQNSNLCNITLTRVQ